MDCSARQIAAWSAASAFCNREHEAGTKILGQIGAGGVLSGSSFRARPEPEATASLDVRTLRWPGRQWCWHLTIRQSASRHQQSAAVTDQGRDIGPIWEAGGTPRII